MVALEHAMRVLSWQENLTKEEMPPEWMWPLDEEIVEHFEWVEQERKARIGGSDEDEEPPGGYEESDMLEGRGAKS